jgi:hypothetical protein
MGLAGTRQAWERAMDTAEKRGELIQLLEMALALAEDLEDGTMG